MLDLRSIYYRLPYPGKVLAASLRGAYLQRWRYGPETDALVAEARAREAWTLAHWSSWQEERLEQLLNRVARAVPYYRRHWEERRRRGDHRGWETLENWPVLTKEEVRRAPEQFLAEDRQGSRLFRFYTSGSTGTPLTLWAGRRSLRQWYALFEARWRGWHGVDRRDRWAIFGGQIVVPAANQRPPFWVWNGAMRQLYISSIHVAPWSVREIAKAIRRSRAVYVLGYPSALFEFAKIALESSIEVPQMKVVLANAEPLYQHQRETIGRVFRAPVVDTYGLAEMTAAAGECVEGGFHLWPDAGIVEVLRDDSDLAAMPGESGRLVCTGLINDEMPLVRLEVGDRGSLTPAGAECPCGRALPRIGGLEGRIDDVVLTPDGRRVGRLDPAFKKDLPIRAAQVVQETQSRIRVLVEPSDGFSQGSATEIVDALRERLGDMEISVEPVERIPRGPNGKVRGVINHLLADSE